MALILIEEANNASVMLDDETAGDDARLREALTAEYPMVKDALIERKTQGEQLTVTVVSRAVVKCEGQTIPVSLHIAQSDKLLIDVLLPYYPSVADAEIRRQTVDGRMEVRVVKKVGHKAAEAAAPGGLAAVLLGLQALPEWINPVTVLGCRLKYQELTGGQLGEGDLLELQVRIEEALQRGEQEVREIAEAIAYLQRVPAEPVGFVPLGF